MFGKDNAPVMLGERQVLPFICTFSQNEDENWGWKLSMSALRVILMFWLGEVRYVESIEDVFP